MFIVVHEYFLVLSSVGSEYTAVCVHIDRNEHADCVVAALRNFGVMRAIFIGDNPDPLSALIPRVAVCV